MPSLCQSFIGSKLSFHFGEDKTKITFFKGLKEINISFVDFAANVTLSRETIASKALKKINVNPNFLYRQRRYLTPVFRWLLCTALIRRYFDYGFCSWFPLQKAQNNCIRFCLNLPPRSHIDLTYLRKINWLPASERIE